MQYIGPSYSKHTRIYICMYSYILLFFLMAVNMHGTSGNQANVKTLGNATQNPFSNILVSNWYQAYSKPEDF